MCVVGPREFDDGSEEILPHHILGSLQELKMEALARRNTQVGLWSWENAAVWHFSRGSVWCLQYLLMLPSTYQEQGRPEVWFFPALSHSGGGFAFRETAPTGFGVLCAGPGHGRNDYTDFLFPLYPAQGVREELMLQPHHCWSICTQINTSIVFECVPAILVSFLSD